MSEPTPDIALIALDLDGTLLNSRQTLSPRAIAAIGKASARGIKVVLASARPPRSVRGFHRKLNLSTPSIHYNGGLLFDFTTSRVIEHVALELEIAREMVARMDSLCGHEVIVTAELLDKGFASRDDDDRHITQSRRLFPYDVVGPVEQWLIQDMTKLMFAGEALLLEPLALRLARDFAGRANVVYAEANLIQVGSARASKGLALARLASEWGISRERVMAIGDADNDVEMLDFAGFSVAMANAPEHIRRSASLVTQTNDQDGCAIAIEKILRQ